MNDIANRADVETLVNTFYDRVKEDDIIGPIFNNAIDDWSDHLPKMYNFWSSIILQDHSYSGNPMMVHLDLARKVDMGEKEFGAWLALFRTNTRDHFIGPNADIAIKRAENIARLMQHKIAHLENLGIYRNIDE